MSKARASAVIAQLTCVAGETAAAATGQAPSSKTGEESAAWAAECLKPQPGLAAGKIIEGACLRTGEPKSGPYVAEPIRNLTSIVYPQDYPIAALRRFEEGSVEVRLQVTPEGRVSECAILVSSGSDSLDSTSCALMRRRARFKPLPRDQKLPEPRIYIHPMKWKLPNPLFEEMPRTSHGEIPLYGLNRPEQGYTRPRRLNHAFASAPISDAVKKSQERGLTLVRLVIAETGRIRKCHIVATTVSRTLTDTVCPDYLEYARYAPARDAKGKMVEAVWHELVDWESSK